MSSVHKSDHYGRTFTEPSIAVNRPSSADDKAKFIAQVKPRPKPTPIAFMGPRTYPTKRYIVLSPSRSTFIIDQQGCKSVFLLKNGKISTKEVWLRNEDLDSLEGFFKKPSSGVKKSIKNLQSKSLSEIGPEDIKNLKLRLFSGVQEGKSDRTLARILNDF